MPSSARSSHSPDVLLMIEKMNEPLEHNSKVLLMIPLKSKSDKDSNLDLGIVPSVPLKV